MDERINKTEAEQLTAWLNMEVTVAKHNAIDALTRGALNGERTLRVAGEIVYPYIAYDAFLLNGDEEGGVLAAFFTDHVTDLNVLHSAVYGYEIGNTAALLQNASVDVDVSDDLIACGADGKLVADALFTAHVDVDTDEDAEKIAKGTADTIGDDNVLTVEFSGWHFACAERDAIISRYDATA